PLTAAQTARRIGGQGVQAMNRNKAGLYEYLFENHGALPWLQGEASVIARLSILLPFVISVRDGDQLPPHEFDQGSYHVRIYPPSQAALDPRDAEASSPVPIIEISHKLNPAQPQIANSLGI